MDAIEHAELGRIALPDVVRWDGPPAIRAFVEFFVARIRNGNTRGAYHRAGCQFFVWCAQNGITLQGVRPIHVATYVEHLGASKQPQTVKQHLSAIRSLFDWLVIQQVVPLNPTTPVKGPRYSVAVGKTPVLSSQEMQRLFDSIGTKTQLDLRDRALIGLMFYTFARVSAAVGVNVGDLFIETGEPWVRLREKGGRDHRMPLHPDLDAMIRAYLRRLPGARPNMPLFRATIGGTGILGDNRLDRRDAWAMIRRRATSAGLDNHVTCHSFRAMGLTSYLSNGGSLDTARVMAGHTSTKTTQIYDRRKAIIERKHVRRIVI